MKLRNLIWVVAAVLAASAGLSAQSCSMGAVAGTYAMSCSGWLTVAAPATVIPVAVLGTVTISPDGSGSGSATQSAAGTVTTSTLTGVSMTIKSDCTGTVKYVTEGVPMEHLIVFSRATGEATSIFTKNPYVPTTVLCKFTPIVK